LNSICISLSANTAFVEAKLVILWTDSHEIGKYLLADFANKV
jgi:hypothetical protein